MKEIKVKLHYGENGDYVELWKVIKPVPGEPKYYGRYTYMDEGTWYYVSDPLGNCELSHSVPGDVMFILCDEKGNECTRYSNADENRLPKLETVIKNEWQKVKDKLPHNTENYEDDFWAEAIYGETTLSINQWLLTFKDPDLYRKEIDDLNGYDENWLYCRTEEINYQPVPDTRFTYLGHNYQFTKVVCRHKICGVEWIEYKCTDSPYVVDDFFGRVNYYLKLGNWFDASKTGEMLTMRVAREMVASELLKLFPKEKKYGELLYIDGIYCYKKGYIEVAEFLIKKELHKDKVLELIANLKNVTEGVVFIDNYENKKRIREKYPDIYGYDYCLV